MDLAQINFNPQAIFEAPCHMNFAERMWLFATVYALGVERYLEIGTARGGSALIVDLAFAILERGGVTCRGVLIDKSFSNVSSETRQKLCDRFDFIEKPVSIAAMREANYLVADPFDFVLIDGNHRYNHAIYDTLTVLPFVRPGGFLLLHDAAFFEVRDAVRQLLRLTNLTDCGYIARHVNVHAKEEPRDPEGFWAEEPTRWGGMYLLRAPDVGPR